MAKVFGISKSSARRGTAKVLGKNPGGARRGGGVQSIQPKGKQTSGNMGGVGTRTI